ncbi:DUF3429 domain-containing protein [Propionivibrio sp.]|uniref:DUF3429 domain-containing protein n=1 Tax=Propionivibrio sp. TaxID=2212460 RepID=UPI003BF211BB
MGEPLGELNDKIGDKHQAVRRTSSFIWSVVPALLAWLAFLLPPTLTSLLLVSGLLAHYWQVRRLVSTASLPAWYLPLRLRLSSVACLCLTAGGVAQCV